MRIHFFIFCVAIFLALPTGTYSITNIKSSFTVNDNQYVFISSPVKKGIQVYDSYGVYIKDSPSQEKFLEIQKIISCPCGGYLLIVDAGKKEVIVVDDKSGAVLRRIKGIASIGDITISREKSRYEGIVNLASNSIHLYTEKGTLLRIIKGEGLFKDASAIHMNNQNHIFVADNLSHKLIELDIKGSLVRSIEDVNVVFGKILDISSDQSGNLYVLDEEKGLLKFSPQGKKIKNIPYPSSYRPLEIGIDDNESSVYLFSEPMIEKLTLDFVFQLKVQKPLSLSKKSVIQLKIGSRILNPVGYDVKIMDTSPFIDTPTQRTFVPLRVISESFKATVSWNAKLNQVSIQKAGTQIILTIGSKIAKINGTAKSLDAAPLIKDNRTFVPLRFIGETYSAEVIWYPDKRLIRMISPFIE